MGETLVIYSTHKVLPQMYEEFIETIGGKVTSTNYTSGYIEGDGGIVWFNGCELDEEEVKSTEEYDLKIIKERYGISVSYYYCLEVGTIGSRDGSKLLLKICKEFMKRWPSSVLMNDYEGFFSYDDIMQEQGEECWFYRPGES